MKFAIMGAGAMGCRLGYQLFKNGEDVILVDSWADHVKAIKQNGLMVDFNGTKESVNIPIYFPDEVNQKVDVIILLSKAMALKETVEQALPLAHEQTTFICLLNGLGHERILLQYMTPEQLIMGTTIWTAQLIQPGEVLLHGVGNITIQNFVNDHQLKEKAESIAKRLDSAGLHTNYSDDVFTMIWKKSCVNGVSNALSALLETHLEGLMSYDSIRELAYPIILEISTAAKTKGIHLDVDEITDFVITASKKVGAHYTSMYQDLVQNHRRTEVDFINGEISRIGKEHGFATPYCDFITHLIHHKEHLLNAK